MWKNDDDLWLTVPDDSNASAIQIAFGIHPLRITATAKEDTGLKRKGYIDVKIVAFDRKSREMHGCVVENTTDLSFRSLCLIMNIDEEVASEICRINKIDGIRF